jgi:putative transposase
LEFYRDKYGFTLLGYVIMPDHVHLLLWWDKMEKPDLNISKIMQGVKGATARRIIGLMISARLEHPLQPCSVTVPKNTKSHKRNLRYRLWQHGFYDFNIYSEEKLAEKLNYIHHNPVKSGLVSSPTDYKWSSYKLYSDTPGVTESIRSPDIARGADAPRYP